MIADISRNVYYLYQKANLLYLLCFICLQIDRYAYIMDLLLSSNNSVLLSGEQGCGKTALIEVNNERFHSQVTVIYCCSVIEYHNCMYTQ